MTVTREELEEILSSPNATCERCQREKSQTPSLDVYEIPWDPKCYELSILCVKCREFILVFIERMRRR